MCVHINDFFYAFITICLLCDVQQRLTLGMRVTQIGEERGNLDEECEKNTKQKRTYAKHDTLHCLLAYALSGNKNHKTPTAWHAVEEACDECPVNVTFIPGVIIDEPMRPMRLITYLFENTKP